ncbi:MAG TPA: hypothetical protein VJ890_00245, partial [Vineibacter sp.]|nr:hypothetical protein [Vineibacter sp.]
MDRQPGYTPSRLMPTLAPQKWEAGFEVGPGLLVVVATMSASVRVGRIRFGRPGHRRNDSYSISRIRLSVPASDWRTRRTPQLGAAASLPLAAVGAMAQFAFMPLLERLLAAATAM